MPSDITIRKLNEVHLEVVCNGESIAKELSDFFTFYSPGYKYHPAYKSRHWDGKIRLWNMMNKKLYVGLHKYVSHFAEERGYSLDTDCITEKQPFDGFVQFIMDLNLTSDGKKIIPYPHQITAILEAYCSKRRLILSPTASGKSLVIYCLLRKLETEVQKKILVVVPSIQLVEQLFTDFIDYSSQNTWETATNCHQIFEGATKVTNKKIVISTWQSIYKMPKAYFDQFDAVIIDECFDGKTPVLTPKGWVPISEIQIGDEILNRDPQGEIKIDKVINTFCNMANSHSEKMYELEFDEGTVIRVTGNHQLLTKNRGWVRADQITEQDEMECLEHFGVATKKC